MKPASLSTLRVLTTLAKMRRVEERPVEGLQVDTGPHSPVLLGNHEEVGDLARKGRVGWADGRLGEERMNLLPDDNLFLQGKGRGKTRGLLRSGETRK